MTAPLARNRFLADSVSTASPGRRLVMLYDRLILDLSQAEERLADGDREASGERLLHAQEIVAELAFSLADGTWDGAPGLSALYGFLLTELVGANIKQDAPRVAVCRELLEPLRDAWREAVATEAGPRVPVA